MIRSVEKVDVAYVPQLTATRLKLLDTAEPTRPDQPKISPLVDRQYRGSEPMFAMETETA